MMLYGSLSEVVFLKNFPFGAVVAYLGIVLWAGHVMV